MSSFAACATILLVVCFQVVAGPLYAIYGIRPDFVLLALALVGLTLPPPTVYIGAVLAGGLLDALSPGIIGPHMTGCILAGFLMVRGRRMGFGDTTMGKGLLSAGAIAAGLLVPHLASWVLEGASTGPGIFIPLTYAYTCILAYPFFQVMTPMVSWPHSKQRGLGGIGRRATWQGLD